MFTFVRIDSDGVVAFDCEIEFLPSVAGVSLLIRLFGANKSN